jgi:pimeloyl-ACP methyl ester carboxylesterase
LFAFNGYSRGLSNQNLQSYGPYIANEADVSSGFTTSDGFKIFYKTYGEGYPIVLVHGWGASTQSNWEYTGWIEKLRPFRKIISIDVRGHGQSDKSYDQSVYSYGAMSNDVLAVMDHLGIEKADLMGYSMGAFMGAYLLGHHSDRFSAMVLGGIGDETQKSADLSYLIAATLRAGKRISDFFRISDPHFDMEALALSCLQMWPEGYPRTLAGPGVAQAETRVLVINGGDDLPYADTDQDFVALIPRGTLRTIPHRNHLTVFLDRRFERAVLNFLSSTN